MAKSTSLSRTCPTPALVPPYMYVAKFRTSELLLVCCMFVALFINFVALLNILLTPAYLGVDGSTWTSVETSTVGTD